MTINNAIPRHTPMKMNKAQLLALLLKPSEKKDFELYLGNNRKPSMLRLFRAIIDNTIDPDDRYTIAFEEPYSEKKDYLLRNELRHLSNELTKYIIQRELLTTTPDHAQTKNILYLSALLQRGSYKLYTTEAQRLIKDATNKGDHNLLYQLLDQYFDHVQLQMETTIETYHQLLNTIDNALEAAEQHFSAAYIGLWRKRVFVQRTLKAIEGQGDIDIPLPVSIDWQQQTDPYLVYNIQVIEATKENGATKIVLLKKASELIDLVVHPSFDKDREHALTAASIALEYFLIGQLEESLPYHHKALSYKGTVDNDRMQAFLFNYLATLMRLEKYTDAIDLIDEHGSLWLKSARLKDRTLCMKAMCHIFLSNADAAYELIPTSRRDSGIDHYYYYRVIQIIVYYMRGDLLLAINETDNFLDTIHYRSIDDDTKDLVLLIKRFLKLENERPALDNQTYNTRINELTEQYTEVLASKVNPHNSLLYKWLGKILQPKG